MCYCDYNSSPSFFSDSTHAAKKPHKCCECRGPIHPGEKYKKRVGVWDGDFATFKQCVACSDLEDYVRAHVPCMCRTFTELFEDIDRAIEYAEQDGEIPGFRFSILRRKVAIRSRRKKMAEEGLVINVFDVETV